MYSTDKIKVIENIAHRLMMSGKVKNPELAQEIARKWVIAK